MIKIKPITQNELVNAGSKLHCAPTHLHGYTKSSNLRSLLISSSLTFNLILLQQLIEKLMLLGVDSVTRR